MLDLGFLVLISIWSAGLGLWILKCLDQTPEHQVDALALAVPLGLGALALAALGLAELGMLNRAALVLVLMLGAWPGGCTIFAKLRCVWMARPECTKDAGSTQGTATNSLIEWVGGQSPPYADCLVLVSGLAAVLGTLLTALAPVTDGDALCYHLQVPKVFLWRGAAVFDPDLHETVYPLETEMLYAVALAFRGPVACRLVQWLLGLVFAANVTALARPTLGPRAWCAGTIALFVPAVSNGMSAPLNDVALAAFGMAALVAGARYLEQACAMTAVLTGLLAGLALGVKYPALVLTGLLVLTMLARYSSSSRLSALRHAAVFAVTAALVGGGWYLRAFVHTGNPVYPFFRQVFGGAGIDEVLDPIKRPLAVNPWSLLTALGPMTLQPDRFDSFSHQFGPVFLLFLPALLLERPPRRVFGLAALGYAFLMLCLTQRQSMRFVLIAVGPMSVAVAWLAVAWWERRTLPARLLVGVLLLALGFQASLAIVRVRHGLNVVLGRESAEQYLTRREPTYRVARWLGRHLPADARLVGQDHRGFYFPRPYTMELAHRRRTGLGENGETAEAVVRRLVEAGFSHVLLCPPVPETAVEFDPTLGRLLAPWLAGRPPLFREEIADADGVVRRYAVYSLLDASLAEAPGRGSRR
jgi:hypothetical protein